MVIRSFLAFELPIEMKTPLARAAQEMGCHHLDVRWVKAENIHLTLVFLGNVRIDALQSIGESVGSVCREYAPFSMKVDGIGMFGTLRQPRVIWAGISGDVDRMSDFRNDLQTKLLGFGIKEEKRPFRPHLTLGRFRKGAKSVSQLREVLAAHQGTSSPTCVAVELVLFRSDLKSDGAVYSRLDAWPLTGNR